MSVTIYCNCAYYQFIPAEVKEGVLTGLEAAEVEFEAVADLCRMCAERDPALQRWAQAYSIRIAACYPRAVKWLFHAAGAPLPDDRVEYLNMRCQSAEEITSLLLDNCAPEGQAKIDLEKTGDWVPWFPVIDYDRCNNCRLCLNFCLFGVYELSEQGRVEVVNPANCKTNCPACANACAHSAIIFPKHGQSPVNGDQVNEAELEARAKTKLAELSKVDVYDTIRRRGKRFAKSQHQDETSGRNSVIAEIQEKLGIPPEVLASLSPAEMARVQAKAMSKDGAGPGGERREQRNE